jgi:ubiquinone/menaquinone biosynthesis C-methylase UbiE
MRPMDTSLNPASLAHAVRELERLAVQAREFASHTAALFRRVGISAGHRVLDLGCGPGDVSFIAAEIVGPRGHVVGVDRSAVAVDAARDRARRVGQLNVTFKVSDVSDLTIAGEFDVIVGRLVLPQLLDPVRALQSLRRYLRPHGFIVLEEDDFGLSPVSVLHQAGYCTQGICVVPTGDISSSHGRLLGVWARPAGGLAS